VTAEGKGPAWGNSLFEDNAEYGFGMRLAVDANRRLLAASIEGALAAGTTPEMADALTRMKAAWKNTGAEAKSGAKAVVAALPGALAKANGAKPHLAKIDELKDFLVEKSVWSIGGDGWAYDIGYGGLDHVIAMNRNVNLLVLDTEVYSNTGGQASKATPTGSVAKFAASGKKTSKKDLGKMAMSYGYVYVASVAMGANMNQCLKAFGEAEAYEGPSLIIAYSPCINHGIDMSKAQAEMKLAVDTGYWILYRFNPMLAREGKNPLQLDSREPKLEYDAFLKNEIRYRTLVQQFPDISKVLFAQAADEAKKRWASYKKMAE
jgi:pyruvate-ferredoxin/flavodoxin oxidoreductase